MIKSDQQRLCHFHPDTLSLFLALKFDSDLQIKSAKTGPERNLGGASSLGGNIPKPGSVPPGDADVSNGMCASLAAAPEAAKRGAENRKDAASENKALKGRSRRLISGAVLPSWL